MPRHLGGVPGVPNSTNSLRKRTLPSQRQTFTPPACMLRAVCWLPSSPIQHDIPKRMTRAGPPKADQTALHVSISSPLVEAQFGPLSAARVLNPHPQSALGQAPLIAQTPRVSWGTRPARISPSKIVLLVPSPISLIRRAILAPMTPRR